jgi:regulator of protease activity HflC (stomatin/prohibitin superfamily)
VKVLIIVLVIVVVLLVIGAAMSVRVVKQYEQGVLFRFGKVLGARGPGLRIIVPVIDVLHRVSLRIVTMPIQSQGIITRDNVSVDVSAVAYFRVADAVKSVVAIEDVGSAIDQIAMARQAEAEREKRAKIINAEGESLAAAALGDASDIMMAHPLALQLRNLQSLVEIGVDKNTTVVFPAPLMTTIAELGSFLATEKAAASVPVLIPAVNGTPD